MTPIVNKIYFDNLNQFEILVKFFQVENDKINLSSFNDKENILNKHIFDSLNIFNFEFINNLYNSETSLSFVDIGTGGGFPGLALAICLPNCKFYLIDSIGKKCTAIKSMVSELGLNNVEVINDRVENLNIKCDISLSRAVAEFEKIFAWSSSATISSGHIYLYKSIKEEIINFNHKFIYKIDDSERVIYEFVNK